MSSDHHDCTQVVSDLYSLASSESQTRERVIQNDMLFARPRESHLVELTTIDFDPSHSPRYFAFKDHSQLSAHLADDATRVFHRDTCIEV